MKERELRQHAECSLCHRRIGESGSPLFWRVSIERFGVDLSALQRQAGLTAMLGGNAAIAQAMGLDEDLAKPVMDKLTLTVCEACAIESQLPIAALAEIEYENGENHGTEANF